MVHYSIKTTVAILTIAIFCTRTQAQFLTTPGSGNWRIDNSTYNVGRVSLSTGTTFPYAFFIDGANLYSNTGDVFGTDAPSSTPTAWRMLMGGTEIGRFWNGGTNFELNIGTTQTGSNPNLNFYTSNTHRMTILGNSGLVGIGTGFTPNYKLDVDGGDINVNSSALGYRINGNYVLRNNADVTSIFAGVGAGNSNSTLYNTFVGYNSGNSNASGFWNTFVGAFAGYSNTSGSLNIFIGDSAGYFSTTGQKNIFIGTNAGFLASTNSLSNIFIGGNAGHDNVSGQYNVIIGRNAGYQNTSNYNCFYGKDAGYNNIGDGNCFYGHHAGWKTGLSHYNSIFGFQSGDSIVGSANCIIGGGAGNRLNIGDNNTFIGTSAQNETTIDTLYNSICI